MDADTSSKHERLSVGIYTGINFEDDCELDEDIIEDALRSELEAANEVIKELTLELKTTKAELDSLKARYTSPSLVNLRGTLMGEVHAAKELLRTSRKAN
ncbi:hypothetical protein D3C71_1390820 [compost metagenome]